MSESLGEKLTSSAAVLTLGLGLTALFLDVEQWYLIFVVGWLLVVPLLSILFEGRSDSVGDRVVEEVERSVVEEVERSLGGSSGSNRADGSGAGPAVPADREDVLDLLRERYARGELDDAEFERKVQRLLETESLADAEDLFGADATDEDREPATERS